MPRRDVSVDLTTRIRIEVLFGLRERPQIGLWSPPGHGVYLSRAHTPGYHQEQMMNLPLKPFVPILRYEDGRPRKVQYFASCHWAQSTALFMEPIELLRLDRCHGLRLYAMLAINRKNTLADAPTRCFHSPIGMKRAFGDESDGDGSQAVPKITWSCQKM